MKYLLRFLEFFVVAVSFISCGTEEAVLTQSEAMNKFKELSPKEGAEFYVQNREQYSFLDTLYQNSIMPAVLQCNYFDLDSVSRVLANTKFKTEIDTVLESQREELLGKVKRELDTNALKQMEVYKKYYLPYLEMSLDSMIDEDVDEIMSKYAGGFMNFRKIAFFFGRDRNDFKKIFWEKFDTLRYKNRIRQYINSFYDSVKVQQDEYCKSLTGSAFGYKMKIATPNFTVGLTKSTLSYVKDYTSKQTSEMFGEVIKDYVMPLVLTATTGGLATIYDIGNTAYDVNSMVKELKNAKIDDDEMVKYICSHDVSYQIKNFYFDKWTSQVDEEIKKSNCELFHYIEKNL